MGADATSLGYNHRRMQKHDNGMPFNDSLNILNSALVYMMAPNAVFIHRSSPDSFKGLVSRHHTFGISNRRNLEMSRAYLALWPPPRGPPVIPI